MCVCVCVCLSFRKPFLKLSLFPEFDFCFYSFLEEKRKSCSISLPLSCFHFPVCLGFYSDCRCSYPLPATSVKRGYGIEILFFRRSLVPIGTLFDSAAFTFQFKNVFSGSLPVSKSAS